ncbi:MULTISPECIES: ankyrin repeat domain-containing protein [Nostocales]|uniref:Ankyrin n=3 Tax=Nostocales TaxID=1161 RepID=A0A8S9T6P6_9CYAN|nr:ankyrin repeat domain-containing protein [Tolypothrix bouteillei]KAF3888140.1 hypothetical protein DA73_0400023580 [Tolypothrix bouteillei VB521301]
MNANDPILHSLTSVIEAARLAGNCDSYTDLPIPILYAGAQGNYFSTDLTDLPVDELAKIHEVDGKIRGLEFRLLGKLILSHLNEVTTYVYVSEDSCLVASVMRTRTEFAGVDIVTYFADDAILTTTTVKLQVTDNGGQKLFRRSHPELDIVELVDYHLAHTRDFASCHGDRQPIFTDLLAVAVLIDESLQRQENDPMNMMLTLVNALGMMNSSDTENIFSDEDDSHEDEQYDEDEEFEEEAKTPLMAAVISGDVEAVKALLSQGAAPDPTLWHETPPLVVAARKGYVEIVRELIAAGTNVNRGFEYPPIFEAALKGQTEVLRVLIEAGANVNACDGDGITPLMDAAYSGHLETVKLLVASGADVNAWGQGETPLLRAAAGGHRNVYDFLYPLVNDDIKKRADKTGDKQIQATLKRKARKKNKAVEKFITNAMYGNLKKVQKAIAQGIDVNAIGSNGCTALMYAASYGHIPVIEALLNAGAEPNILSDSDDGLGEGKTALMMAAESFFASNRVEVIKLLVQAGADVNLKGDNGQTALMCAAFGAFGYIECVKTLIDLGADVNARDDDGNTLLMKVELHGREFRIAPMLRQAGASEEGMAEIALIKASEDGDVQRVRELINTGVNVNHFHGAALGNAAYKGHREIIELLIQAGANVNLGVKSGLTPLARAAHEGHSEIVRLFLQAGADLHARCHDGEGYTALEYAEIALQEGHQGKGHAEVIAFLRSLVHEGRRRKRL